MTPRRPGGPAEPAARPRRTIRRAAAWIANRAANWRKRHRSAVNFYLHALGMPACFLAAPLLLLLRQWPLALSLFLAGYALQFVGHLVEGNRSGEELFIRRLLGRR